MKIKVCILFLVMLVTLASCGTLDYTFIPSIDESYLPSLQDDTQNKNDAALEYMEQKYGERFEYVSPSTSGFSSTYRLLVSCPSLPNQKVYVQLEEDPQGKRKFGDNYIAVKYAQETTDFLQSCAASEYGDVHVFYTAFNDALSSTLTAEASFTDFLSDPQAKMSAIIEVKESSYRSDDQAENLTKRIVENGTQLWLTLVFVEDDAYGTYTKEELADLVTLEKCIRCAQITHADGDIHVEWQGKK